MPCTVPMQRLANLIDQLVSVDLNVADDEGSLADAASSVPEILALLHEAQELLDELRDPAEPHGTDADDLDPVDPGSEAHVRGLLRLLQGELVLGIERVDEALADGDPITVVSRADDALRRLRSGLTSLEENLCHVQGIAPPARVLLDLEIALEIRRHYAELKHRSSAASITAGDLLKESVAWFPSWLEQLQSAVIYRFMRIEDRLRMRELSDRIRAWLSNGDEGNPTDGRRVLDDLLSFSRLLQSVNNRPELREHDRSLLVRASNQLLASTPLPETIPDHLLDELKNLRGLDDDMDEILMTQTNETTVWEPVLRKLLAQTLLYP
jgi:hypothetical protein